MFHLPYAEVRLQIGNMWENTHLWIDMDIMFKYTWPSISADYWSYRLIINTHNHRGIFTISPKRGD